MNMTTIQFTKPVVIDVWRQLDHTQHHYNAGDRLVGVLYTDHTLENLTGDHHLLEGTYKIVTRHATHHHA